MDSLDSTDLETEHEADMGRRTDAKRNEPASALTAAALLRKARNIVDMVVCVFMIS